jgi:hypothetical protein
MVLEELLRAFNLDLLEVIKWILKNSKYHSNLNIVFKNLVHQNEWYTF